MKLTLTATEVCNIEQALREHIVTCAKAWLNVPSTVTSENALVKILEAEWDQAQANLDAFLKAIGESEAK